MTTKELYKTKQIAQKYEYKNLDISNLRLIEEKIRQEINQVKKRMSTAETRRKFSKENYVFELNRAAFYRQLKGNEEKQTNIEENNIMEYWDRMWRKEEHENDYTQLLQFEISTQQIAKIEITKEEV